VNVEMGSESLECLFPHLVHSSRRSNRSHHHLHSLCLLSCHRVLPLHLLLGPSHIKYLYQRRRARKRQ